MGMYAVTEFTSRVTTGTVDLDVSALPISCMSTNSFVCSLLSGLTFPLAIGSTKVIDLLPQYIYTDLGMDK